MALVTTVELYGTIITPLGEADSDVTCLFSPVCNPQFIDNYLITIESVDTTTDSTGYFSIDLIGGARYRVTIDEASLVESLVIPTDQTSYNLFQLLSP